jgi:hypothetical protein
MHQAVSQVQERKCRKERGVSLHTEKSLHRGSCHLTLLLMLRQTMLVQNFFGPALTTPGKTIATKRMMMPWG